MGPSTFFPSPPLPVLKRSVNKGWHHSPRLKVPPKIASSCSCSFSRAGQVKSIPSVRAAFACMKNERTFFFFGRRQGTVYTKLIMRFYIEWSRYMLHVSTILRPVLIWVQAKQRCRGAERTSLDPQLYIHPCPIIFFLAWN